MPTDLSSTSADDPRGDPWSLLSRDLWPSMEELLAPVCSWRTGLLSNSGNEPTSTPVDLAVPPHPVPLATAGPISPPHCCDQLQLKAVDLQRSGRLLLRFQPSGYCLLCHPGPCTHHEGVTASSAALGHSVVGVLWTDDTGCSVLEITVQSAHDEDGTESSRMLDQSFASPDNAAVENQPSAVLSDCLERSSAPPTAHHDPSNRDPTSRESAADETQDVTDAVECDLPCQVSGVSAQDQTELPTSQSPSGEKLPFNSDYQQLKSSSRHQKQSQSPRDETTRRPGGGGEERSFVCQQCGKSFSTRRVLNKHALSHSTEARYCCNQCGKCFRRADHLTRHARTHQPLPAFSCSQCERRFSRRDSLSVHERTHSGQLPEQCDVCGVRFAARSNLLAHRRTHYRHQQQGYVCSDCGRSFLRADRLRSHRLSKHGSGDSCDRFVCEKCGKGFFAADKLRRHSHIHSGNKPFSCSFCPKVFARKDKRDEHAATHQREKHECPVCGREFLHRQLLTRHQRMHKDASKMQCPVCLRFFGSEAKYTLHVSRHDSEGGTAEAPNSISSKQEPRQSGSTASPALLSCHLCSKTFRRSASLNTHFITFHSSSGSAVSQNDWVE